MRNVLTFDVEEYFQVSGFRDAVDPGDWDRFESRVERQVLPLLDRLDAAGAGATFFVLGHTAERHPALVREIAARGHEIASHGYGHDLVYDRGPRAFRRDVRRAREVLSGILGFAPAGYRAPSFSVTAASLWALPILAEEGHLYDSSVVPIRHDRYGIPGSPPIPHVRRVGEGRFLRELPPLTRTFAGRRVAAGGGGWFRLFPYGFVAEAVRRMNGDAQPAAMYFHPWEFDPDQPRIPGTRRRARLRHFVGMKGAGEKLRRLLGEFEWGTAREALRLPEDAPAVSGISTARAGRTSSSC